MKYTVKSGETIYDVSYNTVGSLGATDAIIDSADITDYSAVPQAGMELEFDMDIQNNAATLKAGIIPFNSTYIPETQLDGMINELIALIDSDTVQNLLTE